MDEINYGFNSNNKDIYPKNDNEWANKFLYIVKLIGKLIYKILKILIFKIFIWLKIIIA